MVEQCICNRLQGDEIAREWVAFSTTKNGLKLNLDTLEHFEHEVKLSDLAFYVFEHFKVCVYLPPSLQKPL